jgi:hypothetical protein
VIILDENTAQGEVDQLRRRKIICRKIGPDIGRKGLSDREIISLLHGLDRPTLFSLDRDFFRRRWCHGGYALVHLDIVEEEVAKYVRRVLKHPLLNSRAKRVGLVLSASPSGLTGWRLNQQEPVTIEW